MFSFLLTHSLRQDDVFWLHERPSRSDGSRPCPNRGQGALLCAQIGAALSLNVVLAHRAALVLVIPVGSPSYLTSIGSCTGCWTCSYPSSHHHRFANLQRAQETHWTLATFRPQALDMQDTIPCSLISRFSMDRTDVFFIPKIEALILEDNGLSCLYPSQYSGCKSAKERL